jgi:hypothetical protein
VSGETNIFSGASKRETSDRTEVIQRGRKESRCEIRSQKEI